MNPKKILLALAFLLPCITAEGTSQQLNRITVDVMPVYRAWAETDSTLMCGVIIQTPSEPSARKLPVHVVVAIDVSRDMQGEALTNAKKAASLILSRLQDGDYFSIISYSTYARTVFPMQPINAGTRRSAESGIDGLGGESNRNLKVGMDAAAAQFNRFKSQNASGRHLFIMTNGDPDKGLTDYPQILSHAYTLSQSPAISISTFAIEDTHNETLFSEMAQKTGGRYYYAEEPQLLSTNVQHEISRITAPGACSINLSIEPPGDAVLADVFGGEKKRTEIFVGDIATGTKQFVFFKLKGRPSKQKDCVVEMEYTEPGSQNIRRERIYVDIPLTDGEPGYETEIIPYYLVFSIINDLVTYSGHVHENRRKYTDFFRNRITELEQENVALESDYIRQSFSYFQKLDWRISNTAVEPQEYIKGIKFDALQFLRGTLIK